MKGKPGKSLGRSRICFMIYTGGLTHGKKDGLPSRKPASESSAPAELPDNPYHVEIGPRAGVRAGVAVKLD